MSANETENTPVQNADAPAAAAPQEKSGRSERRQVQGVVVSDKMDKTITVEIIYQQRHPKYGKYVRNTRRFKAHDETNDARMGDRVLIMETRKFSKDKNFRLIKVLERAPQV